MDFEIIEGIAENEVIADKNNIRVLVFFREKFGIKYKSHIIPFVYRKFSWRKLKNVAQVKLNNGEIHLAEIHWFKSRGVGEICPRIKKFLD